MVLSMLPLLGPVTEVSRELDLLGIRLAHACNEDVET